MQKGLKYYRHSTAHVEIFLFKKVIATKCANHKSQSITDIRNFPETVSLSFYKVGLISFTCLAIVIWNLNLSWHQEKFPPFSLFFLEKLLPFSLWSGEKNSIHLYYYLRPTFFCLIWKVKFFKGTSLNFSIHSPLSLPLFLLSFSPSFSLIHQNIPGAPSFSSSVSLSFFFFLFF